MFPNLIAGVRECVGARKRILSILHRMESSMATATEQLNTLTGKVDDLTSDVRAALAVINADTLSDTAQAALDGLSAKIEAFVREMKAATPK